jgi:hypothetical protein
MGRSNANIHGYVQNLTLDHTAKFRLCVLELVMESADCAFGGRGMIILRERIGNAELGEFLLIVGFHEESARVAKNLRAQLPDARN